MFGKYREKMITCQWVITQNGMYAFYQNYWMLICKKTSRYNMQLDRRPLLN